MAEAANKLITGAFADDGTAQTLLKALRSEKGIITANTFPCRGIGAFDESGVFGRLPPARPVKVVSIVVPAERADEIFDFVCAKVDLFKPGGGFLYQGALDAATRFALPAGIGDERREISDRRSGLDRRKTPRDTSERRTLGDRRAGTGA